MDICLRAILRQYGPLFYSVLLSLLLSCPYAQGLDQVFFNQTSLITLPSILSLRNHIAFSFRTCTASGLLLSQTGGTGDALNFALTTGDDAGALNIQWTRGATQETGYVTVSIPSTSSSSSSLLDNQWYTVDCKFDLGEIHVQIERGASVLERILVSNSTERRFLWDLDLGGGGLVRVGEGFVGCFQGGPSVDLGQDGAVNTNAEVGECPLDTEAVQGCGTPLQNPCWLYPCQNGGSCLNLGGTYSCQCPIPYSGDNCESDLGSTVAVCDLNPCQNGGTCREEGQATRSYRCECAQGFTGVNCEIDIDECASMPCRNGGRCTHVREGYTCDCQGTGYDGTTCTQNIDECAAAESPCHNAAVCMDTPGSYKCQCLEGFRGPNCEDDIKACISNPCAYGGTCVDAPPAGYTCQCMQGTSGDNCQVNADDCADVVCDAAEGAECVDGIDEYSCRCKAGYVDPANSPGNNPQICTEVDECASQPCRNGATCEDKENSYVCLCVPGYTGSACEVDVIECVPGRCENGGTCIEGVNEFRCQCVEGYTGSTCATDINECNSNPCQNGATCENKVNYFSCTCEAGFSGTLCEEDINECLAQPCRNDAVCSDQPGLYMCQCKPGFTGQDCETNVDECTSTPCVNGGKCIDLDNEYLCNCPDAFMGVNCEQDYDACFSGPCRNNGTCATVPPARDYTCDCLLGFRGNACEENIDDCVGHTCPAYEECRDGVNEYTCQCPIGREGPQCEQDIDECLSNPCMHGAACTNLPGAYRCDCPGSMLNLTQFTHDDRSIFRVGYEGERCETNINECAYAPSICLNEGKCEDMQEDEEDFFKCFCPSGGEYFTGKYCQIKKDYCQIAPVPDLPVCQNGATCVDIQDNYLCQCAPGFNGTRCKHNIDECASNPCMQGGTCEDGINSYLCVCPAGLTGAHCETNINECSSEPCQHGGGCLDQINGYQCNCTDTGYAGVHCDINIDDCEVNPCVNGANCTDGVKDFTCTCHQGYAGKTCEIDMAECDSAPCQNDAACVERSDSTRPDFSYAMAAGYDCACTPGFTGIHCESDIDECASNPCVNGLCQDRVNGYTCDCVPGYRGDRCEVNIQECDEWLPCEHGSTCMDRINDYSCVCAPEYQGLQYGGKNCTVELVGCAGNTCLNGATCMPYLVNETQGEHNYSCMCAPGFKGDMCATITTASFTNAATSWERYDFVYSLEIRSAEFRFRTTLAEGVLLADFDPNRAWALVLSVGGEGMAVRAEIWKNGVVKEWATVNPGVSLINGEWQKVSISFYPPFSINLIHPACPGEVCTASLNGSVTALSGSVYIGGGEADTLAALTPGHKGFIGCMQDIRLGPTEIIVPADVGLVEGCPRVAQCTPDTCSGHGVCVDLWTNYRCDCHRPYYGKQCNTSYVPATFGFEDSVSYASFRIPASAVEEVRTTNDITLFFRSRKDTGLLFYFGGDLSGPSYTQTYLAAMLDDGNIVVKLSFAEKESKTFTYEGLFSNGEQHFLKVFRSQNTLVIEVNETQQDHTFNASFSLNPKHFYMGGMPENANRRKKRQAVDMPIEAEPMKGTIQDVQQNGYVMEFFAADESVSAEKYDAPVMSNVKEGEVSDDVCAMIDPCVNNATCETRFFNDYECLCPEGYKGKNCSVLDFCMYTECPANSTCNDLADGFECVSPATFNGQTSLLRYTQNLTDASSLPTSLSFSFRTREPQTSLVSIYFNNRQNFVRAIVQDSSLVVHFGSAANVYRMLGDVNDGEWHAVNLVYDGDRNLDVSVDDNTNTVSLTNVVDFNAVLSSPDIYVGGQPLALSTGQEVQEMFKGCMEAVRLGGVLLPFFLPDEMVNNTAANQFIVQEITDVDNEGCKGDPVCNAHDCQNGATCVDVWNAFECDCALGFNESKCENNIDDCPGNLCENGANCVDGIANYTCDCLPGFTGEMCGTDIDECFSDPCMNNGTCTDGVNGYNCTCEENFVGTNCEYDLRENCANDPCQNNATCNNVTTEYEGILTFNCSCEPGFTGKYCESEIDYCEGDPCQNNATCDSVREMLNYTCNCADGYEGRDCEMEIDECASNPCENGGTCKDFLAYFECDCAPGWEGVTCAENINECNGTINGTEPCENGECVDLAPGYECKCDDGWEGDRCDEDINECLDSPCKNGAECNNMPGSYECVCTEGYEGWDCEKANCSVGQCQNGATCRVDTNPNNSSVTVWRCDCVEYYEGDRCEIEGGCVKQPCERGTCENVNSTDYECDCPEGWTGKNCSDDIDECLETPPVCQNGATCYNYDGGFNCTCATGYEGDVCQTTINYCERDSPCQNGGICTPEIGGFECDCTDTGYNGTTCEEDIDECLARPCIQGDCNNFPGGFTCKCFSGYVGDVCHSYNPCNESAYCRNNGTCTSVPDDVEQSVNTTCSCHSEWKGEQCELPLSEPGPSPAVGNITIYIIVGVVAFVVLVAAIVFIVWLRSTIAKRANQGTYSPSRQEMSGARVEMANGLKIPPPERLI